MDQFFAIDGARQLGEVALVDVRSPVGQANVVFYETLFDENAASHIAFGQAYPGGVRGGSSMTEGELHSSRCEQGGHTFGRDDRYANDERIWPARRWQPSRDHGTRAICWRCYRWGRQMSVFSQLSDLPVTMVREHHTRLSHPCSTGRVSIQELPSG